MAASAATAKDAKAQQREQKRADFFENIGCQWLCASVKFAPNVDELGKVLGHEMLKAHSAVVGNAVIEKVANFNFVLKAQVVGLNQMARNIPELQAIGPQLAAALLSNSEADTFSDEVLDFVNNISAEAPAARVKESTVVQLLDAAKAWIKRIHGDAPFKKWSYHKPTAAETAREQVVAMRGVIQDIAGASDVGRLVFGEESADAAIRVKWCKDLRYRNRGSASVSLVKDLTVRTPAARAKRAQSR